MQTLQYPSISPVENSLEHPIKVLPIQDGWCVAVGKGHYAQPLSRDMAVMRASAIARTMHLHEIGIYDDQGLIERIAC